MKNYQRLYTFSLTVLLSMVSMSTWGEEWNSGDCKVIYDKDTKYVDVKGDGRMADYGSSRAPWYNEAVSFRRLFTRGVTHIGIKAFGSCSDLREANMDITVTSIGDKAFANCFRLESFNTNKDYSNLKTIGEAVFSNCNSLTSVTLPDKLDSIGSYAFECCENLKSITIPNRVKHIGAFAFYGCRSLTSFTFTGLLTTLGTSMFSGCTSLTSISIPEGVTSVGASAFYGCKGLTTITIPSTVRNIGDKAFYNCTSADNVYCYADPDSLLWRIDSLDFKSGTATTIHVINRSKWVGKYGQNFKGFVEMQPTASGTCGAQGDNVKWTLYPGGYLIISGKGEMANFENAGKRPWHSKMNEITSVIIEEGVTSISRNAFTESKSLIHITFPSTLKSIGEAAFKGCKKINSIKLPEGLEMIGYNAFSYCDGLTELYIPAGVKTAKDLAFNSCKGLKTVTFAENSQLEVIPYAMFSDSPSLEKVYIPASVKTLDISPFGNCHALKEVIFAANSQLQTFKNQVFYNCYELSTITIPSGVTSLGDDVFKDCMKLADVYCYADPEKLSWGSAHADFMDNRATKFHVYDVVPWIKRFSYVNVTFVGDLKANTRGDENTEGTTDIKAIDNVTSDVDDSTARWYTLDGRMLLGKPTQKGIYIINGKKIVIR